MEHLYDIHYHLDLQKDRSATIGEIENNQIYTIAVTNLPELYQKEKEEIKSKYIRIALGFHPELVHQYKRQIPLMWDLLTDARYVGEVGLDFVDETYKTEQISFFEELIEQCRFDDKKILTIHSRRAVREVLRIIGNDFKFKPILHWFTGTKDELLEAIEKGCFISVNGAMLGSNKFLSMLPLIPDERLLIETDSPFTYLQGTYSNTLKTINAKLLSQKKSVDVWNNFRNLLEQTV